MNLQPSFAEKLGSPIERQTENELNPEQIVAKAESSIMSVLERLELEEAQKLNLKEK